VRAKEREMKTTWSHGSPTLFVMTLVLNAPCLCLHGCPSSSANPLYDLETSQFVLALVPEVHTIRGGKTATIRKTGRFVGLIVNMRC
jgi:hypothetical protein